jgi:uncharacterized protein YdaU (DUF1376 family)
MHYYKFEIATWHLHTSHLSLIEEAVYFRLINFYYDTESPIPKETQSVIRRLRLSEYSDIVAQILGEFFELGEEGWHQKHCDLKIVEYHAKGNANKINGKKGGRPKKESETQSVISGNPNETLIKNNKQLIINNELQINTKPRATRLSQDWQPSISMIEYCKTKRPDLQWKDVAESFRDYWVSAPKGTKLDWEATWRTWVRNQRQPAGSKAFESAKDKSRREFNESIWGKVATNEQSIIDIN